MERSVAGEGADEKNFMTRTALSFRPVEFIGSGQQNL
jgi:hypothetical protein